MFDVCCGSHYHFAPHVLRIYLVCFFSYIPHLVSSVKAGVWMLYTYSRIFLLQLVMKVSLCSDSRRSFSPYSHRESQWRAERYTHHVLFVVPVTSQMSPGKTASIPAWLLPSDFSNGVGNSRASRENQLQGAGGESGFTAFMINSICIFIDKCYSTGNFAPLISQRACSSKQDLMIYLGAG